MSRHHHPKVRGYFTIGVYRPKNEVNIGTLWRTAHIYGASQIFTVGHRYSPRKRQPGDTTKAWHSIPLTNYEDIEDLLAHLPFGCPLIGIELDAHNPTELPQFSHPPSACYLLGAEDNGIPPLVLSMCHKVVTIPTPNPYCMNVATAGSIVLYDRHTKLPHNRR